MKLKSSLFVLMAILMAGSVLAQKKETGILDTSVVRNIKVLAGTLPQNANDKQDFTVRWDAVAGSRKFESFQVDLAVTRADGSIKSDTKQVNGNAREVVIKLKGNSNPQSSDVKITAISTVPFTCKEKFSGPNLSVNEPPPSETITANLGLVDIQSITPLNAEEAKKKQTFDVKFQLPANIDPKNISKFQIAMDVTMDNNTVESDKKTPNPAAGSVTLKVKSPGAPVTATVTASGENKLNEIAQAKIRFLNSPEKEIKK